MQPAARGEERGFGQAVAVKECLAAKSAGRKRCGEAIERGRPDRFGAADSRVPGAQIELSGEQCETIHFAHREFTRHIEQLVALGHEVGAVGGRAVDLPGIGRRLELHASARWYL